MMKGDDNQYLIIPKGDLVEIKEKLSQILNNLTQGKKSEATQKSEYIGQSEAEKFLNKKTTWFWQMRKAGKLQFKKLGNKNYYKREELEKLFDSQ